MVSGEMDAPVPRAPKILKTALFMPLMTTHDKISNAFETNEFSIAVPFDLAKAFNTVNHDIFCIGLATYGVGQMGVLLAAVQLNYHNF